MQNRSGVALSLRGRYPDPPSCTDGTTPNPFWTFSTIFLVPVFTFNFSRFQLSTFNSRKAGFTHFGHLSPSFWTPIVQNHFKTVSRTKARRHEEIILFILDISPAYSFMGLMGPIGTMGLMGVLDFSPVRFVRFVRCSPPFWTPCTLILDTSTVFCFHNFSRLSSFSRFPLPRSGLPHFGQFGHYCAEPFFHHEEHEVNEEGHSSQRIASSGAVIR